MPIITTITVTKTLVIAGHIRCLYGAGGSVVGQYVDRHDGTHLRLRQPITEGVASTGMSPLKWLVIIKSKIENVCSKYVSKFCLDKVSNTFQMTSWRSQIFSKYFPNVT